jgi:2-dehydro-3-deoxyglucarate aldolase/4-hydroxy-2-oxoheptanedioate aldolase
MDLPENRMKRWLAERPSRAPLGSWLMTASPLAAEAMGHAGFDFLVLDMEHVPIGVPEAFALMQAVAGTPAEVIVRLPDQNATTVKRVMDAGGRTLMFPFVETAEQAAAAVAATRYPPEGIRGAAAMTRASAYGTIDGYLAKANREAAVIVQLESPAAIARLPEIAAVEGVDAVFAGPGDLAVAMGHPGNPDADEVQAKLREAAAGAARLGKACGIVGPKVETVRRYLDAGFTYAAVASDLAFAVAGARAALAALRQVR